MPASLLGAPEEARRHREETTEVDDDIQAVLDALQDPESRCILRAVVEEPRTVAELTDYCDIPRTTAYRKVDRLLEASMLESRTRIRTQGHHAQQYAPTVSAVTVSFSDGEVDVALDGSGTLPAD